MRVVRFKSRPLHRFVVGVGFFVVMVIFVGMTSQPIDERVWSSKGADGDDDAQPQPEHRKPSATKSRAANGLDSHNAHQIDNFDESRPKSLIILTYQRSGSSLVGDMFSRNPNAFYLFEPLDAVYVAMYGINHGWSVPSDITHYWNGTHRQIPEEEIKIVADYLDHMLACDIAWLPTEALTHNFWKIHRHHMTHLNDYIDCIIANNFTYPACEDTNPWSCGRRFGQVDERRNAECRRTLWNGRYERDSAERKLQSTTDNERKKLQSQYADHFRCMSLMRTSLDSRCAPSLQSMCRRSSLRVVKATRASMRSVGELLDRRHALGDRNTRVVHAYRDPRAVATSRHRQGDPLLGKHAAFVVDTDPSESILREARMYCRTAADDFRYRRDELELRHPGVVTSLDFDRAAEDVVGTVDGVYRLIAATKSPAEVATWAEGAAVKSRNVSSKWRARLSIEMSDRIMALDECVELCRYIECR